MYVFVMYVHTYVRESYETSRLVPAERPRPLELWRWDHGSQSVAGQLAHPHSRVCAATPMGYEVHRICIIGLGGVCFPWNLALELSRQSFWRRRRRRRRWVITAPEAQSIDNTDSLPNLHTVLTYSSCSAPWSHTHYLTLTLSNTMTILAPASGRALVMMKMMAQVVPGLPLRIGNSH